MTWKKGGYYQETDGDSWKGDWWKQLRGSTGSSYCALNWCLRKSAGQSVRLLSYTVISEPSAVFPAHTSSERERGKVQGAILMELFGIQRWNVWNNECSVLGTSFELVWSAFKCIHILLMLFFFSIWFFESVFDFFYVFVTESSPNLTCHFNL